MLNNPTTARLVFAALLLCSGTSATAQNPPAAQEEEKEVFVAITCGLGRFTYEYPMPGGEAIVVRGRAYGSIALADAALEHRVWSADGVIERAYIVDEKGRPRPRAAVRFGSRIVRLERDGEWLLSTEASSPESLLKFEAREERERRRARSAAPPE